MKRLVFCLLSFLSVAFALMACTFQEPEEPTATAPATPATVVHPFLSGPTPTAQALPTRTVQEVVVTRIVEPDKAEPSDDNRLLVEIPADLEPAGESEHFTFYVGDGAEAPPMDELSPTAEEIFRYVSWRLGAAAGTIDTPIDVLFRPPSQTSCPPRGMALAHPPAEVHDAPLIYVFAGPDTGRDQIVGVLAHEVAHILHARALEQGLSGNRALDEGFAHWLSAEYVYAWYGTTSYDALVRGYLAAGTYLPLHEHYELQSIYPDFGDPDAAVDDADCLQRRDQLYSEWASFIGFLIDNDGIEQFLALMDSPSTAETGDPPVIHPPDYEGVYGLALNQLEVAWLRRLLKTNKADRREGQWSPLWRWAGSIAQNRGGRDNRHL